MAASVDSPSSSHHLQQECNASSVGFSPLFSPSSDKRFWSSLLCRIDAILHERQRESTNDENQPGKRLKEDSMLLMRGFDSIGQTLSQLSTNLDNALQGARDLANPPTLTELFSVSLNSSKSIQEDSGIKKEETLKKGLKRKLESSDSTEEDAEDVSQKTNVQTCPKHGNFKKAKNIAISMATRAASLARELKSIKSDLCFMQERCCLLEEENRILRDGFAKGMRPEEDDLVRLQLEALLTEKSRLTSENADLIRENQCLQQLVEYHQLTSEDLSASYEQVIQGICLDFSSPSREEDTIEERARYKTGDDTEGKVPTIPDMDMNAFSSAIDKCQ